MSIHTAVVLLILFPSVLPGQWVQLGSDIDGEDVWSQSGSAVGFSLDGSQLAVGAYLHDGTGDDSGQVRVFRWVNSNWIQKGADINGAASGDYLGFSVALSADGHRLAVGVPYAGGTDAGETHIFEWHSGTSQWILLDPIIYGEAAGDMSGWSVSLSSDGTRVAIGAPGNGHSGYYSGHARVFERIGSSWVQKGWDMEGQEASDTAGASVALSPNGSRIAIGSPGASDHGPGTGRVEVYRWSGTTQNWHRIGTPIAGDDRGDAFGFSVVLSSDGFRLAIGSPGYWGGGPDSGLARVFEWSGASWIQLGQDIYGEAEDDRLGRSLALSLDGTRLAVGGIENDGNGDDSGHVVIYQWSQATQTWRQLGIDIDGEAAGDRSGASVGLSADGSRLAVGAPGNDDGAVDAGHVRVYTDRLFFDGFESGDISAWSAVEP